MEVSYKDEDYSFNLIVKNSDEDQEFTSYILKHDTYLADYKNQINFLNLSIMKRLLRSWRRKFSLIFIPAEILDWMVVVYAKHTLSDSVSNNL
jgi:hypothetical protein